MKMIKTTLSSLIAVLAFASCSEKEETGDKASQGTPEEQFIESYKQADSKGADEVMKLVYRPDRMPDEDRVEFRQMVERDLAKDLVSVEIVPFDNPNYEKMNALFSSMGLMLPAKPSNSLKLSYEQNGEASVTILPMGEMDGKYYIFTLIKVE